MRTLPFSRTMSTKLSWKLSSPSKWTTVSFGKLLLSRSFHRFIDTKTISSTSIFQVESFSRSSLVFPLTIRASFPIQHWMHFTELFENPHFPHVTSVKDVNSDPFAHSYLFRRFSRNSWEFPIWSRRTWTYSRLRCVLYGDLYDEADGIHR